MAETKSIPTPVKVVSILYYIVAALVLLIGLVLMLGGGLYASYFHESYALIAGAVFFIGIILIGLGILNIFVGRGIWTGKNWARITALVFAALGVLNSLTSIISLLFFHEYSGGAGIGGGVVQLAIHGVIIYYLGFDESVKAYFKKQR